MSNQAQTSEQGPGTKRLQEIQTQYDNYEKRIQQLEKDVQGGVKKGSEQAQAVLKDIRNKQQELSQRMIEVKKAGKEAASDLKTGLENAWNSLKQAVDQASHRMPH